jgi:TnsA endonuclease-like protein
MARRTLYEPINAAKYSGRRPIILKSSWETSFARIYCDLNPACIDWSYEPWRIKYHDPVSRRQTIYIPDFLMSCRGNSGTIRTTLVEIKPIHETLQEHARNRKDSANIARNLAKWTAARAWCERRGKVSFVVLTEMELFPGGENIRPPKRQIKPYGARRVKKI